MNRHLIAILMLLGAPAAVGADPGDVSAMSGFRAEYEVLVDGKPAGDSVMELVATAAGHWQHRISAVGTRGLARLARFSTEQTSSIEFVDGLPRLLGAEMQSRSLVRDRDLQLEIDWGAGLVRWLGDIEKGEPQQRPLDGRPTTGASLNLQLAFDARRAAAGERVDYILHDRGRRRELDYVVGAAEPVVVPAGRYSAIPLRGQRADRDRVTTAWYDPALPPTPVRVLQTEDGKDKYELRLKAVGTR